MGETVQNALGVGQLYVCDHLQGAIIGIGFRHALMDHGHFHQLFADAHGGVQGRHGFLIDHRNLGSPNIAQLFHAHLAQIAAFELDGSANDSAVLAQILHDTQSDG